MRRLEHLRCPRLYTLIVAVLAFLLDVNVLFRFKVVQAPASGERNTTVFTVARTNTYKENVHVFNDLSLSSSLLFQYVPLVLLVVFNAQLVAVLAKHSRKMKLRFGGQSLECAASVQYSTSSGSSETDLPVVCLCIANETRPNSTTAGQSQKNETLAAETNVRSVTLPSQTDGKMISQNHPNPQKETKASNVGKSPFSKLEKQRSVTVLVYSILFILLALPNAVFPLVRKLVPGFAVFEREHYLVLALGNVFTFLDSVSAAMNFFVYFAMGSSFRKGVYRLFRR
ncbi:hypothetical protein BaRGS_00022794 [Batillaria attramentaria]|uniref:G-protein coupled receptors family 1 profile domain-containing protein n=1 Tax=Batillaria attramentaria TaxID=370345 RepID=A0ABD0KFW0_9CAEN